MDDDFFERPSRRPVHELNLVPIIDMFSTVIFFLVLSTSFIAFTKLTIPPSKVSTITDPVAPPPLAPKMLLFGSPGDYRLHLSWAGREPGTALEKIEAEGPASEPLLLQAGKKLATGFHEKYPEERSLQIGLAGDLPYQGLISVMDGVRDSLPDIVLISYQETEQRAKKLREPAGGAAP
jgi:biopolymer transport protein ExbD